MDTVQIYAITLGGILCLSVIVGSRGWVLSLWEQASHYTSKYLTYPYLISRHRLIGPWNPAFVIIHCNYVALNIFCLSFNCSSLTEAAARAGTLSLANSVLPYAGPHLSFLADLTTMSLDTYKRVHRSAGLMTFALAMFHVLVMAGRQPFSIGVSKNLFGLLGIVSLFSLVILFNCFFRRHLFYEIFLRVHQGLAVLFLYSMWIHIPFMWSLSRLCYYITIALFLFMLALQSFLLFYRNGVFHYRLSRAFVNQKNSVVEIKIELSRPLKIKSGQYINLWIPTASFWTFFQTHPFMVVSWSEGKVETLDLLVVPRRGLSGKLLLFNDNSRHLIMFSGPHGSTAPIDDNEVVILVADGSGIIAQLPYLKQLVSRHNNHRARTRKVHLIWSLSSAAIYGIVKPLLQEELEKDNSGYILNVSIYYENLPYVEQSCGRHATFYKGEPDLRRIIGDQAVEKNIDLGKESSVLVIASGKDNLRDCLREIVRGYLDENVRLIELDYQPQY